MKTITLNLILSVLCVYSAYSQGKIDLGNYPNIVISNNNVRMKVFTPDPQNGLYRATRFDWSGVIGSVQFKGHEYYGYWKDKHNPTFHEDVTGPAEGFIHPGLGYEEAKPNGKFIRIGVGILEKPDEQSYSWKATYKIIDNGKWKTEHGEDWISFKHIIYSDFGYGYIYTKTIRLKNNGFYIEHALENTGEKAIETDQFNHNFLMIDKKQSGPPFKIIFPYKISTADDPKGFVEIDSNELRFTKKLEGKSDVFLNQGDDDSFFLNLEGFSNKPSDHKVTVIDEDSGAGLTFSVDKPLYRMAFWACKTTLCPENFIWISVKPGKTEYWTSDYTLFVK